MLEIAQREVPNAKFIECSIEDVDIEDGSLDLVVSSFAIIHVPRDQHKCLFERIYKWLRPGGVAFLGLGASDNPADYDENWHGVPMTWSHFDAETNLQMLESAGFVSDWHQIETYAFDESHLFVIARRG